MVQNFRSRISDREKAGRKAKERKNMGKKFASMTPKYPHILHGGDYNPDQWIDYPEIVERDIELMKKAHNK